MICGQVLCGTEPYPDHFRAKKYRLHDKFFTKTDFQVAIHLKAGPLDSEQLPDSSKLEPSNCWANPSTF